MTQVTLRFGQIQYGPAIELKRAPLYLRFVTTGDDWKTLDALDMPEDVAKPGETMVAAKCVNRNRMHLDGRDKRKRIAEWIATADYQYLDPQPKQETMRDARKWNAWCAVEHEKAGAI
jgi:hypothetical protein